MNEGGSTILATVSWIIQPLSPVTFLYILLWMALVVLPLLLLSYAAYFLITIPLRRKERARLFIDLLQTGIEQGQRPENVIVQIAAIKERSVGIRFHLLAAHIENGLRLSQALDKVPRFLPPQVSAMLKAGEEMGDISKVFPACRSALQDANSQVTGAFNYVILVGFVFAPVTPLIYLQLRIFVFPKFQDILYGVGGDIALHPLSQFIFSTGYSLALAQLFLALTVYFLAALYIGGPRVSDWFRKVSGSVVDRLHFSMPWRRKRMQRDFAQMLSVLLDSNVPEPKAVELAGASTANSILRSQSKFVMSDLSKGETLQNSLQRLSDSDEFQWRLKNAVHSGGFLRSLTGWFDYLDAKAFQQEQAAAHFVSTGFVILNGVLIGLIVAGIFQFLILLINEAVLW